MKTKTNGFTLVELLVVITIIGAIAGLAIPAISAVMKNVRVSAMKSEMTSLESGIESYYTKYGDYPPDFFDWGIVKRHYLKIFPDISSTELDLLFRLCDNFADNDPNQLTTTANVYDPSVMDRAEALVWSLGGFSSDPQFPFTGKGGPLVYFGPAGQENDPSLYEYNPIRNAPEIDLEPDRVTFVSFTPGTAKSFTNRTQSTDEVGTGVAVDVFPTYLLRDESSPVVYFDSRTYAASVPGPSNPIFNGWARALGSGEFDVVRPVYSTNPNVSPVAPATYGSLPAAAQGWFFENAQTFQLLAPGLDGRFGDVADADPSDGNPGDDPAVYFQTDGNMVLLNPAATSSTALLVTSVSRFDVTVLLPDSTNPFKDNMANFIDKTFEDELE